MTARVPPRQGISEVKLSPPPFSAELWSITAWSEMEMQSSGLLKETAAPPPFAREEQPVILALPFISKRFVQQVPPQIRTPPPSL